MKRFLVVSLGALLVAAAAGASAQGLSTIEGRGRDEGRGLERSAPAFDGGRHDSGGGLTERGGARGLGREQDWGGGQQPVQPHTRLDDLLTRLSRGEREPSVSETPTGARPCPLPATPLATAAA